MMLMILMNTNNQYRSIYLFLIINNALLILAPSLILDNNPEIKLFVSIRIIISLVYYYSRPLVSFTTPHRVFTFRHDGAGPII